MEAQSFQPLDRLSTAVERTPVEWSPVRVLVAVSRRQYRLGVIPPALVRDREPRE